MSEPQETTYRALITLTLPSTETPTSVTVTLAPSDQVAINGRCKPLRECTLADLQAYADALEADVWETYEAITLYDLKADAQIGIEIALLEPEMPLETWSDHALVLSEPNQLEAEMVAAQQSTEPETEVATDVTSAEDVEPPTFHIDVVTEATEAPEAAEEVEAKEPAPAADAPPAETDVPEPIVSQPELQPRKAIPSETAVSQPEPETVIQPSKARVRVAGRQLPNGHHTWAAVDVLIDEPALRQSQAHALSSLDREVAGVLVGPRPEKQPDGRYLVHVIDTIAAKYTVMQGASVTYTPESWRYLNDTLSERYPDETAVMVGWYHTHPGFGIFLSGMDLFIHQNFFTQIWHVAYVLDPRARTSGFFCWDRQRARVSRYDFAWPAWARSSW